ncbi:ABC transporter ATP-binding protein [Halomonas sp. E19]|uniref:ABC transporter ATP-binding protein n=1 Tax=Halomonas sp. E19 TaxID=3397247 RepID=UPI00403404D5
MASSLIRFVGVQKTYDGEHLVVKDLNLTIQQGEFVTLLGPSGSGKTTCLMMLAGFEVPTSGDIFLREQRLNSVPPHKRNFGMVFQNYALFPHMTVEENIRYSLKTRRLPAAEADRKVAEVLDKIQLRQFAKRRPTQLSGGQQQRVALAGPWCSNRSWSSWTSRWVRWTSSCASRCSWRSSTCMNSSVSPWSS